MAHGPDRPRPLGPDRLPGERAATAKVSPEAPRRGRSRAGALVLAGVLTVCLVPATNALAAEHRGTPVQLPKRRSEPPHTPTVTRTVTATVTSAPATDPVAGGPGTGEEPAVRSGEDLRWWPWGPVVSGRLNRPVRGGFATLVLQRGRITAVGTGTVTVASDDGVTITWTVSSATHIVVPGRGGAREVRRTTAPTSAPSSVPASALAVGERVGVWGTASGDVTTATFIVVRSTAPAPGPTSTSTSTSTTTTSSTESTTSAE